MGRLKELSFGLVFGLGMYHSWIWPSFRERSMNDRLVRLETFIPEAFVNRQHLVSVFFDYEGAYDSTWKCCTLNDRRDT